jgi:hypothetical protein
MPTELDHIFICASRDANAEAACLIAFGLTEGAPNTHPGQGTACRRFFFRNAYLELLWVSDPMEAQSEMVRRTRLWERWTRRADGACPFGFGLRPGTQEIGSPPFADWEYRPPYLPEPSSIQVAQNSDVLTEPMLFHLPFARRPDTRPNDTRQPLAHTAGLREISSIKLVSPYAARLSAELATLTKAGLVQMRDGPEYLIELGFDGKPQGQKADFRPTLPLVFHR